MKGEVFNSADYVIEYFSASRRRWVKSSANSFYSSSLSHLKQRVENLSAMGPTVPYRARKLK